MIGSEDSLSNTFIDSAARICEGVFFVFRSFGDYRLNLALVLGMVPPRAFLMR